MRPSCPHVKSHFIHLDFHNNSRWTPPCCVLNSCLYDIRPISFRRYILRQLCGKEETIQFFDNVNLLNSCLCGNRVCMLWLISDKVKSTALSSISTTKLRISSSTLMCVWRAPPVGNFAVLPLRTMPYAVDLFIPNNLAVSKKSSPFVRAARRWARSISGIYWFVRGSIYA